MCTLRGTTVVETQVVVRVVSSEVVGASLTEEPFFLFFLEEFHLQHTEPLELLRTPTAPLHGALSHHSSP